MDLIDCSSGGLDARQKIPAQPGYQAPFAQQIRDSTGVMTGAVGMIEVPAMASQILRQNKADVVILPGSSCGGLIGRWKSLENGSSSALGGSVSAGGAGRYGGARRDQSALPEEEVRAQRASAQLAVFYLAA